MIWIKKCLLIIRQSFFSKDKTKWLFKLNQIFYSKYKGKWCEDLPEKLSPKIVYIVGTKEYPWQSVFLCPCNCGSTIFLDISPSIKKRWKLTEHKNKTISLHPSVWRTAGCRSHFFLSNGRVKWAVK